MWEVRNFEEMVRILDVYLSSIRPNIQTNEEANTHDEQHMLVHLWMDAQ